MHLARRIATRAAPPHRVILGCVRLECRHISTYKPPTPENPATPNPDQHISRYIVPEQVQPQTQKYPPTLSQLDTSTTKPQEHHHDEHHDEHHHHEGDHHHAPKEDGPHGFLFGEKPLAPGEKRKWQDWELPYYLGFGISTLMLVIGLNIKPDTRTSTWASETLDKIKPSTSTAATATSPSTARPLLETAK